MPNIPAEERKVAEKFLNDYPEALPSIRNRVLEWSPTAKEFLRKYFDENRIETASISAYSES